MPDLGSPIAYLVLAEGTPVYANDATTQVGRVKRVLADEGADLFDGIVLDVDGPDRFVDAPEVADLYEGGVVLTLDADQARALPEHSPAPATIDVSAGDVVGDSPGSRARDAARRVWNRLSGNY